jgi:putative endonuclease
MNNIYFVYVLWSDNFVRKYVGITENIETRLKEHNSGKTRSTKAYMPWRIIYTEKFNLRIEARKREKYFKTAAGRIKTKI